MDVLTAVRTSKMSPKQVVIIALCFLIFIVDGFDVFIMGFALPYIDDGFFDSDAQRGFILSAGLIGMALGALLLAPLADRFGRRRLVVVLTAVTTLGMLLCGLSQEYAQLLPARILTGLCIGAIGPSLSLLVQEYSSDRRRNVAFGFFTLSWSLGTFLSGVVALSLMQAFDDDWRVLFYFGTALGTVSTLIAVVWLPESIAYLQTRDTPSSRRQLAKVARRLGLEGIDLSKRPAQERPAQERPAKATPLRALAERSALANTIVVVVLYSVVMFANYWVYTWTPQIVATESGDAQAGSLAGTILSMGGVLGALAFTLYSLRRSPFRVHGIVLALAAASFIGVAATFGVPVLPLVFTAIGGLLLQVGIVTYGASVVPLFPISSRATVLGLQGFTSRIAGILAPIVVGFLLAYMAPSTMFWLVSIPLLIGALGGFHISARLSERGEARGDAAETAEAPTAGSPGTAASPPAPAPETAAIGNDAGEDTIP